MASRVEWGSAAGNESIPSYASSTSTSASASASASAAAG